MRKIVLASLALFAMSGCTKDPAEQNPKVEDVLLMLIPTAQSVDALTRAAVIGEKFMHGNQVGFSILKTGSQTPHIFGYSNIMARGASSVNVNSAADSWVYYVNGNYMGTSLGGISSYGNIDVFGYHPYDGAVTDIEAVPFSIGATTGEVTTAEEAEATKDYMWATPETNIDIATLGGHDVKMNFNHLMTCLEFGLKKQYYGPALTVESIKFEISGNQNFTTEGTYNAKTGAITETKSSKEITVNYSGKKINNNDPNNIIYMQIILPELKYTIPTDDATIKATFTFKTNALYPDDKPVAPAVYTFTLSKVKEGDTLTGLLAGKRYQVRIDVGNYTKFSGSPIVQPEGFTNVNNGYDNQIGI